MVVSKQLWFCLHSYIHPAISQIGLQYATGVVCGGNARAVALLCALKQVSLLCITSLVREGIEEMM